ncbi:MAG: glucose-6-phosphate dehydrogenase [Bacilli bacterium]|nr:glucose-6-phosphate dehydrogenase [Bacilli bacterium]
MQTKTISLVIFGSTGDLTHRKLMPALYNLEFEGNLPENINVIAIGRRDYNDDIFRNEVKESIHKYSRLKLNENAWDKLSKKIKYLKMDYSNQSDYAILKEYLDNHSDNHDSQNIFYLAVSPEHFEPIVSSLKIYGLGETDTKHPRLVIEKPFGSDLASAKFLNDRIVEVFSEENTYRIDHYLGKEMLQNIMVIRFSNIMFEPVWNNKFIKKVIINSSETIGIGSRGNYFENFGIIRDMVQSHLLQLMSLIAMDKPKSLKTNDIRDEKIKVLKQLKILSDEELETSVIRGQYETYKQEKNVDENSTTETYIAFKAFIDNERWKGVPFYIRTGKKLPRKSTEIIIEFKDVEGSPYTNAEPNILVFKIQPDEGLFLSFNTKRIGNTTDLIPVKMDFCQNCEVGFNSPEAYERLLFDVMRGDATLFARWDEVEHSWKFIDSIIDYWKRKNPKLYIYEDNSWGPKEADKLLQNSKVFLDIY